MCGIWRAIEDRSLDEYQGADLSGIGRNSLGGSGKQRSGRASDSSAARKHVSKCSGSKHGRRPGRTRSKKAVLYVIEDDSDFWGTVELLLGEQYELEFFEDLQSGSRALQNKPLPAGLLVDIIFPPDRDAGLNFVRDFRPRFPGLPVVFISGRNDYEAALQARDLDAGYVHKDPGKFQGELFVELARWLPPTSLHEELRILSGIDDLVFEIYGKRVTDCSASLQEILRKWFDVMPSVGANVERLGQLVGKSPDALNRILRRDFPKESIKEFLVHLSTVYGAVLYWCGCSTQDVCQKIGMTRARFYENCKVHLFVKLSEVRPVPLSRVLRGPGF